MSRRVVFGEVEPPPPVEAADDRRRPERQTYPPRDFEGRPRCIECGKPAPADGMHLCEWCREVIDADHG